MPARLRSTEGRNVGKVVNDIQNARGADIFVETDTGRFVIRGPNGREHIIEGNVHVTTMNLRTSATHLNMLRNGERILATEEQVSFVRSLIKP